MKLEPGFYRTRDGRKAEVLKVGLPDYSGEPTASAGITYSHDGGWELVPWDADGYFTGPDLDPRDLIAPWRDPIRVEGWVPGFPPHLRTA